MLSCLLKTMHTSLRIPEKNCSAHGKYFAFAPQILEINSASFPNPQKYNPILAKMFLYYRRIKFTYLKTMKLYLSIINIHLIFCIIHVKYGSGHP